MPQADEPTTSIPKPAAAEGRKPKGARPATGQQTRPDLFALTIDAANGRIVALERVDDVGQRQELSPEEKTRLAAQSSATLNQVVEDAFEAGIACVLGESDESDPDEPKADGELSRLLLRSLIERSGARQRFEGETLDRAIVGTLFRRAAVSGSKAAH
jgi:hypothetical protein